MNCPVCGKGIKARDEFCENCGAVLKGALVSAPVAKNASRSASATLARGTGVAQAKICPNCQTSNSPQEEFCINCGANLDTPPVKTSPTTGVSATNGASAPAISTAQA